MDVLVKIYSWECPRLCESEIKLKAKDKVVVNLEHFNELGVVEMEGKKNYLKEVVRFK